MAKRTVKQIIPAQRVNMGGHLLDQPLPVREVEQIDPFLLIHHWEDTMKGGQKQKDVGVGPHPHRGFSPVTFVFKGNVHHRDSFGNEAVVESGGTQWMHAGRGVTHSERPGKDLAENGGEIEFIQFWVNTPSTHKMETPIYMPISDEETPRIPMEGVDLGLIAGEYQGIKGPATTYSPLKLMRGEAKENATISVDIPQEFNTLIYLLNGTINIDGKTGYGKDMLWLENEGNEIEMQVEKGTRFIILAGVPIHEELATYGPFVMNNQTEILEALRDAQMGKMGILIEDFE